MKIAVLGSTGSIGRNVLKVAENLDDIEVYGISTNKDIIKFERQLEEFKPAFGVIADSAAYEKFIKSDATGFAGTKILAGREGINELAQNSEVDMVVNGLSGIAGLKPTVLALSAGKRVATANKESIIMGWNLISSSIQYDEQLIPVDSEHSAILQNLKGEKIEDVRRIILTASGGAVYNNTLEELKHISAGDCLLHPTWSMGNKITIDSATLMNKGFEVIEAHNLFSIDYSDINVYIHPQSVIHGMVEYVDGTIIACLATQDMKIPIQYALTHPERKSSSSKMLDISDMSRLEFFKPDTEKFPCLKIAVEAGKEGGGAPIIMCAADEVAVDSFMQGLIGFFEIPGLITRALEKGVSGSTSSVEEIEFIYEEAKNISMGMIRNYKR